MGEVIIPLLDVLKRMPANDRVIILAHLDSATRDKIYTVITKVLQADSHSSRRKKALCQILTPYKDDLRFICCKRNSRQGKQRKLTQLGGKPLGHLLRAALPALVKVFQQ